MTSKFEVPPLAIGTRVVLPMRRGVVMAVDMSGTGSFMLGLDGVSEPVLIEFGENWIEERMLPTEPETLRERISHAINATSSENGSNTPDFILGEYLTDCLSVFDRAVRRRGEWYGRMDTPAQDPPAQSLPSTIEELRTLENNAHARRMELETIQRREWQAEVLAKGETAELPFGAGDIGNFCQDLVFHAKRLGRPMKGEFNGRTMEALPDSTPQEIYRMWSVR
jgi:hypothetical protein